MADKVVTAEEIEDTLTEIQDNLISGKFFLSFDSLVTVHQYPDGSIDGELRIFTIKPWITVASMIRSMEEQAGPLKKGWASIVLLRPSRGPSGKKGDTGLIQIEGRWASIISTRWYKMDHPSNVGAMFVTAREIEKEFRKKKKRRSDTVIYRIHWNPHRIKPGGEERDRRRKK